MTNNFSELLSANKRDDDYVNATALCASFGKRYAKFSQTRPFQDLKVLLSRDETEKRSLTFVKNRCTYIHPRLAIALASWLSPEFHHFMLGVFERYLMGDMSLAEEVAERNNKPDEIIRSAIRIEGIAYRKLETAALQEAGVTGVGYGQVTNGTYLGCFGMKAPELKKHLGVKNIRDGLDDQSLKMVSASENLLEVVLENGLAKGNKQCAKVAEDIAADVRKLYGKYAS